MALIGISPKVLFSQEEASLANASEIDSGFLDGASFGGYQITITGDAVGFTFTQSLKISESGDVATQSFPLSSTNSVTQDTTFAVAFRERFIRIQIQNTSGGAITNVKVEIKGVPSTAQPTVTPLSVDPVAQSQACLLYTSDAADE